MKTEKNKEEFYSTIYEFKYNNIEKNQEYINAQKEINDGNWNYIEKYGNIKNITELLILWILKLNNPIISNFDINQLKDFDKKEYLLLVKSLSKETLYIYNYILEIFRNKNIIPQKENKKLFQAIILITTPHNILIKETNYTINNIIDILNDEKYHDNESKLYQQFSQNNNNNNTNNINDNNIISNNINLNYNDVLYLQNKIIELLSFLLDNYKVGIDNIPTYSKMKISELSPLNTASKYTKRKLYKSKSESVIKYKKIQNSMNIFKLNTTEETQNMKIDEEKIIENTSKQSILGERKFYNKKNKNNSSMINLEKETKINTKSKNKLENIDNVIITDTIAENIYYQHEIEQNNEDTKCEKNSNIILKNENNNKYILLNLDGNNIKCISNNENYITKKNDEINTNNDLNINTINSNNISLNKDIKYSNKYLKTKNSEIPIDKNNNNESNNINNISINITTVEVDELKESTENKYHIATEICTNEDLYNDNESNENKEIKLVKKSNIDNNKMNIKVISSINKNVEPFYLNDKKNTKINILNYAFSKKDEISHDELNIKISNDDNWQLYNESGLQLSNNEDNQSSNGIESQSNSDYNQLQEKLESKSSSSSINYDTKNKLDYKNMSNNKKIQSCDESDSEISNNESNNSHNDLESKLSSNETSSNDINNENHSCLSDKESEFSSLEWNISDISDKNSNNSSRSSSISKLQNTGFDNINYSDEIDVNKNIYTRDYWTDILLFIDILISSGNFKTEICQLLRKLTLERNLSIYVIYSNCSEEDDEGNITLYKKFIETVNIFYEKIIKMNETNELNLGNNNNNVVKNDSDNIDIINCEDELSSDIDFFKPYKKNINSHEFNKNNSITKLTNNDDTSNSNDNNSDDGNKKCNNIEDIDNKIINDEENCQKIKNIKKNETIEDNNIPKNKNIKNDYDNVSYIFSNNKDNNALSLINCEDEEIDDFIYINQKEQRNISNKIRNKEEKINNKKEPITNITDYIINENDFFNSSKIFIDSIPSTLKLNSIKYNSNTNMTEVNKPTEKIRYGDSNDNDCFVNELTMENEEISEFLPPNINKKRKYKYLKK
ncbi:hypothetical protein BCR32DRAFT_264018 [Anaeromyces robustus]|uniref:Uncharacterized protein n=1 Tax=Anaeromyces robustus TaxID=1754192 RepID=A0A1Y1XPW9_9FUNG|nr:hypothetical protein BCR32DRAFT_264018 [Anaeromyces robustus]|eukprot:ORX87782.1 hypothetical protein BCR32DRAFT_264018 [Anaeromyces robustus]